MTDQQEGLGVETTRKLYKLIEFLMVWFGS
jgi:hypothetical protein